MKVSEILLLDMSKRKNRKILMDKLKELPFFKDHEEDEDVELDFLETVFRTMCKKYPIRLSYIMPSRVDLDEEKPHYSFMLMSGMEDEKEDKWIKTIYVESLYEGMQKLVLFTYAYIKSKNKEK